MKRKPLSPDEHRRRQERINAQKKGRKRARYEQFVARVGPQTVGKPKNLCPACGDPMRLEQAGSDWFLQCPVCKNLPVERVAALPTPPPSPAVTIGSTLQATL